MGYADKVDATQARGHKPTMVDLDRRWQNRVMKRDRMPTNFEMTSKEVKEYKKNMGKDQTKKANQGLLLYRGAKVKIKK